jgi:hypothetical protein
MNKWITISINPPKVGTPITVRTANELDLGYSYETYDFSDDVFDQEEYESALAASDYIEWMDLS